MKWMNENNIKCNKNQNENHIIHSEFWLDQIILNINDNR